MGVGSGNALFVTELSGHRDEGMRNWIELADRALSRDGHKTEVLRLGGDPRWSSLRPSSLRAVRAARPELLIYVPYSGLTSKSLLRHAVLRSAARPRLDVLVVLQSTPRVRRLPAVGPPGLLACASERLRAAHGALGRDSEVLPPVIDLDRFRRASGERAAIRRQLGLAPDRPTALHVGHLRASRGLDPLIELAAEGAMQVVVIASTATAPEPGIEERLRDAGAIVKREYLPSIERWYQAADVYLFPVVDLQGSIEIPLSVLEAMACAVPVLSTPFGGLPSLFAANECLRFVAPEQLAAGAMAMVGVDGSSNRSAVRPMNEDAFARALGRALQSGGAA
jgi:glycosyltransferase involved in cell wall biosynthesis